MTTLTKTCTRCGARRSRCRCIPQPVQRNGSTRQHRIARAQTLAEEKLCWVCGEPGTTDDPLEAGHIVAHSKGGPAIRSNYHAEHRSHNRERGALEVIA